MAVSKKVKLARQQRKEKRKSVKAWIPVETKIQAKKIQEMHSDCCEFENISPVESFKPIEFIDHNYKDSDNIDDIIGCKALKKRRSGDDHFKCCVDRKKWDKLLENGFNFSKKIELLAALSKPSPTKQKDYLVLFQLLPKALRDTANEIAYALGTDEYYADFGWYEIEKNQKYRGDIYEWTLDMWLLDDIIGSFVQEMLSIMGVTGVAHNRAYVNVLKAVNIKCKRKSDCMFS